MDQAKARVDAMTAERNATETAIAHSESEVDRLVARRQLAEESYARIKQLIVRTPW